MIVVGRHLHGELAAWAQRRGESSEERGVIGQPVERRVREHQVDGRRGSSNAAMSPCSKRSPGAAYAALRAIIASELSIPTVSRAVELAVQESRELPRATAEIDDAHGGCRLDQRQEVEERLPPLVAEARVLVGIPGIAGHGPV